MSRNSSVSNPTTQVLLAPSLSLCSLRHRVHFSGVEEVDTGIQGFIEKLIRFGQRVLLAESHGSYAKLFKLHGLMEP